MKKCCFVIQGFGKKQDYEQGKQFNLDASYAVIKEAIEEAGMECCRADELRTNALIDQVMYDELLDADLVVADITTLNFNAGFELGVRYALRPYATLVVGEKGMNFPFDIKHIYIHKYHHLGEDIGYSEAKRFCEELKQLAEKAINNPQKDSPVYTYLNRLPEKGFIDIAMSRQTRKQSKGSSSSLRELINQAEAEMHADKFDEAIKYWTQAREVAGKNDYVVQQLALATYKSKQPNAERALRKAETILEYLKPHESFDTETLGLWAAVHKRLFEISKDTGALEEALFALERGFFIKRDYYNGINLAFMLDTKASDSDPKIKEELRAMARHVRRRIKDICDKTLAKQDLDKEYKYWILATLYETCVGLGEEDEALRWKEEADNISTATWMVESTDNQIAKLRKLLNN
jgi:hypothetical protein